MQTANQSRRDALITIMLSGWVGPLPAWANAQTAAVTDLTPRDVQNQLQALVKEARDAGLPGPVTRDAVRLDSSNVYLESLPRLVDIIDQAANASPALAGRSALLLSEVGAQELIRPAYVVGPKEKGVAPPFPSAKLQYLKLFEELRVRPEHIGRVKWHCDRLIKNQARYETITSSTGVPWYIVGVIHALEASFNFLGHLHNGDVPLDKVTRQVPANRPRPWEAPFTWERSAVDALRYEKFADLQDWSLPWALYRLEQYNGFGYRGRGINSPYLWSFSNHYKSGKYVKDGNWSATAVSQQCGVAVMLHELKRRGTISL